MPPTLPSLAGPVSLLALTLAACAAPPLPAPEPPPLAGAPPLAAPPPPEPAQIQPAPRPKPARVARISFDEGIAVATAPLVDAVVGGQPTSMIVDTGATHHVIAGWLARELATATPVPMAPATDHAGAEVTVSRLDGVPLSIAGYGRVEVPSLLVVEVPAEVRRRGIGGVISPQALVRPGYAVLIDFPARTLAEVPAAEVEERVGRAPSVVRTCGGGVGAGALVVTATIEGVETVLELDTGSTTSSLSAASALGKRLGQQRRGTNTQFTASGAHDVPTVPAAHVALANVASELDLDLLPAAPAFGCGEGYAGMDLLQPCALLIDGEGSRVWCAPRRDQR